VQGGHALPRDRFRVESPLRIQGDAHLVFAVGSPLDNFDDWDAELLDKSFNITMLSVNFVAQRFYIGPFSFEDLEGVVPGARRPPPTTPRARGPRPGFGGWGLGSGFTAYQLDNLVVPPSKLGTNKPVQARLWH